MTTELFFKWITFGFTIVLIGVFLKDADKVNTILTGFSTSYSNILGTLEKAG
jgi:hypothetical protein